MDLMCVCERDVVWSFVNDGVEKVGSKKIHRVVKVDGERV